MNSLLAVIYSVGVQVISMNPYACHEPLKVLGVTPAAPVVRTYGRQELTIDLHATYDNPFNPEDVQVWAVFLAPSGRKWHINGFLDQHFTRALNGDTEEVSPAGIPAWRVRFAADEPGTWRYRVYARDRSGTTATPEHRFRAVKGPDGGFVRRAKANTLAFQLDNGQPFFAVGENMCWPGQRGTYDYDRWLADLGGAGGNWIRIWMCSWNCGLEWSADPHGERRTGSYHGLGTYSLDNAWRLDRILDAAERHGVKVMLCFGTYGEFRTGGYFNEGQWPANPYAKANGGPCAKPEDFWTDSTARKAYRNRLRYIAARYGYRTSIQAWEFWNEAEAPAPWVAEMARYLKGTGEFKAQAADPYRHLITTTYGNDAVWRIPEIDFSQSHSYGTGNISDHSPVIKADAEAHRKFGKPHLMGEFGIDWRAGDEKWDKEGRGINLHNGLWSSALSGNGGTAMIWYWDGYVAPKNLYDRFASVARFAAKVPWATEPWKPARFTTPQGKSQGAYGDLVLNANSGWGKAAVTDYTVTPLGIAGNPAVAQFLYSSGKADIRTTPTFHVKFERPGRFVLHVDTVSAAARLVATLDGSRVLDQRLDPVPPTDPAARPEYISTQQKPEYGGIYQAVFNKDYGFDVPAGEHVIRLENAEGDWVSLETIRLTNYRSDRYADVLLTGLTGQRIAVLWALNAAYGWKNVEEGKTVAPIRGLTTRMLDLPVGAYTVEWWNTQKGTPYRTDRVQASPAGLPLSFPDLPWDIAAIVRPARN